MKVLKWIGIIIGCTVFMLVFPPLGFIAAGIAAYHGSKWKFK